MTTGFAARETKQEASAGDSNKRLLYNIANRTGFRLFTTFAKTRGYRLFTTLPKEEASGW